MKLAKSSKPHLYHCYHDLLLSHLVILTFVVHLCGVLREGIRDGKKNEVEDGVRACRVIFYGTGSSGHLNRYKSNGHRHYFYSPSSSNNNKQAIFSPFSLNNKDNNQKSN